MRASTAAAVNSKFREIERASKELATLDKNLAKIEGKIAADSRKLIAAEKSLEHVRAQDSRRQARNLKQESDSTTRKINQIDTTLKTAVSDIDALKALPDKIQVLFLASNPLDASHLHLDEEARSIHEMIRKSDHQDTVKLESRWALRPLDAIQAINEVEPTIVHFSGHGTDMDEIVFQSEGGSSKTVTLSAIVQLLKASSDKIRLVFFNTCYSRNQAEAVAEHVEATIGMNDSIGDDAARVFASQFYSALGFGKSVKTAFEQGKAALMLEDIQEEDIPELFTAEGVLAEELFIVKPSGN